MKRRMARTSGGDLVLELKMDVAELKSSFREMDSRLTSSVDRLDRATGALGVAVVAIQQALAATQQAVAEVQQEVKTLGAVMREGFNNVGRELDRFAIHLDAYADVIGELRAKVNDHEDRLEALEAKSG